MTSPPASTLQDHQHDSDGDLDETLQKLFDCPPSDDDEPCPQKSSRSPDAEPTPDNSLEEVQSWGLSYGSFSVSDKPVSLSEKFRGVRPAVRPATPATSGSSKSRVRVEQLLPQKRKLPPNPGEKARNSFRVVGNVTQKQTGTEYAIADKNVSNMVLRGSPMDPARLSALFELSKRVDISQISTRFDDIRAGRVGEWVVFGCLVKKHAKRETKTGAKFAVWSLYNMPRWSIDKSQNPPEATMITVLVFDEAFALLHNLVEGSALAMRRATLLPPRESETGARTERGGTEWCGYCIKVTKRDQVVDLGMCQDYRLCGEPNGDSGECGVWFDANRLKMCSRHTQQKRMRMLRGTRMDVNNAERPLGRAENGTSALGHVKDVSRASFREPLSRFQNGMGAGQKDRHVADRKKAMALVSRHGSVRGAAGHAQMSSFSRALLQRVSQQNGTRLASRTDERLMSATKKRNVIVRQLPRPQRDESAGKDAKQLSYNSAVENLIQLGFKVNSRGDLIAPGGVSGITLQKSKRSKSSSITEEPVSNDRRTDANDAAAGLPTDAFRTREDVYLSDESS